jgi:predicted regulator of Ras-like GTPase activity (Roadblock/LC7/MglB family)
MADIILTEKHLDAIDESLAAVLKKSGAHTVLLTDRSGQLISSQGILDDRKLPALAALSAADYGSTNAIANLLGELEFTICFRKGRDENIHFAGVGPECIIITIFGNDTTLAVVRSEVQKILDSLKSIVGGETD